MKNSKIVSLFPISIFLSIFTSLNIVYSQTNTINDNFSMFAVFIAIIISFFTFQKNESFNDKLTIFIHGATQSTTIHMCLIFYTSTIFSTILEKIGSIHTAVNISLYYIPNWFILPGMFIVTSFFSFIVGTSMGAIAAFMPIANNIAIHSGLNPSLTAATIVCGAMFGDNLSILSDTSITCIQITNADMKKKFLLNAKIAAPAFILSLLLLTYKNYQIVENFHHLENINFSILEIIKLFPYFIAFFLALTGLDILIVMIPGIVSAICIGFLFKTITPIEIINLFFDGFYHNKEIVNIFLLILLLSGLSKIMSHNGGIDFILEKLQKKIENKDYGKIAIYCLISIINITITINTISILITGSLANTIGKNYNIEASETACILDIGSCVSQGILPYAPQMLLAASMAHVPSISLLPYLYYQYFLAISLLAFLLKHKKYNFFYYYY